MKNISKIVLLIISLYFMLLLGACGTQEEENNSVLTNLYRGTDYVLDDKWQFVPEFLPKYNSSDNTITIYAQTHEEIDQDTGINSHTYIGGFFTFYMDGTICEKEIFDLPEKAYIIYGTFTDEASYYVTAVHDPGTKAEFYLNRTELSENTTITVELSNFLHDDHSSFITLCCDADGNPYLASPYEILIFNPDLTLMSRISLDHSISNMTVLSDGLVWVDSIFNGERGLAAIDKENVQLGHSYPFPYDADTIIGAIPSDKNYDFYYIDKSSVCGAKFTENNHITTTALMNLVSSGIGTSQNKDWESDITRLISAIDADTFLFAERSDGNTVPVLYCHAEDLDLRTIQTITVAHAWELEPEVIQQIVKFNKEHPEMRVVTLDYSIYESVEDVFAAEEKLTFDIVNRLCEPDIIIGYHKGPVAKQVWQNDLYVDLIPYLRNDDTVNLENLYGGIKRIFDDGKDGMWGISSRFTFETLISTPEILGKYSNKGYWTLEEMLDFLDSLPDNVEKTPANQFVPGYLLCQGFGMFVDWESNTCSFDTDLFKRYLTFVTTLPKTAAERNATSEYMKLSRTEQYYARISGQVGVEYYCMYAPMYYFAPAALFGTKDYVPIGYATTTESGTKIIPDDVYIITQFAEDPVTCWELIKCFFENHSELSWYTGKLFSLRTQMAQVQEHCKNLEVIDYFEGGMEWEEYDPERPHTQEDLHKPGLVIWYSEDDWKKLENIWDTSGNPLINETPDDITDIVKEEISVLTNGFGSVDDCAKKIQSRVSIWLSENH